MDLENRAHLLIILIAFYKKKFWCVKEEMFIFARICLMWKKTRTNILGAGVITFTSSSPINRTTEIRKKHLVQRTLSLRDLTVL